MNFLLKSIVLISAFILFVKCKEESFDIQFENQRYFYSNTEGNNSIEGSHIFIEKKSDDTLFFNKKNSKIINNLNSSWIIGQGSGKPYFDTGKEYQWSIRKVLPKSNAIITAQFNQNLILERPIVFWKLGSYPVKFSDSLKGSWGFSKIVLDKKDNLFKTHLFECDTNEVNLYLATSENLNNWKIKHLLNPNDFKNIVWNAPDVNNKMKVTPIISDVIFFQEKYYSFAYGDDSEKKTKIGVLTSNSLEGKYKVHPSPVVVPNSESKFSNDDVYFPKVVRADSLWLMFYTSRNKKKESFLCVAKSDDLINWKVIDENILPRNKGWNSGLKNMLCAQVKIITNKIHIWVTGAKEVGNYRKPNKGNSMDICIGEFRSPMNSFKFTEVKGNPTFGGNPTFELENDHIGGVFQEIFYENYLYTFYHGKGRAGKEYTILMK